MAKRQLDYFIQIGLKTFGEITEFRMLRTVHTESESIKIITMQRG